jgi:biopolymer transport protein ExbB
LITTAGGMIVAIMALIAFRISISLQAQQMDYFARVGSDLELIYRQNWYEPFFENHRRNEIPDSPAEFLRMPPPDRG